MNFSKMARGNGYATEAAEISIETQKSPVLQGLKDLHKLLMLPTLNKNMFWTSYFFLIMQEKPTCLVVLFKLGIFCTYKIKSNYTCCIFVFTHRLNSYVQTLIYSWKKACFKCIYIYVKLCWLWISETKNVCGGSAGFGGDGSEGSPPATGLSCLLAHQNFRSGQQWSLIDWLIKGLIDWLINW